MNQDNPLKQPETVAEAVQIVLDTMKEKDKNYFRSIKMNEMIEQHHSTGRNIRNAFGLWGGNLKLLEDCNNVQKKKYPEDYNICQQLYATYSEKMEYPIHPDDASWVILQEIWSALNEERNIKTLQKEYQECQNEPREPRRNTQKS